MTIGVKKYNPGFLTDDEIVASFCVRTGEFEALLECLRRKYRPIQRSCIGDRTAGQRKNSPAAARGDRDAP